MFLLFRSDFKGGGLPRTVKTTCFLGFFSRKTDKLVLLNISILESVHFTDISVFFVVKYIERFGSYRRCLSRPLFRRSACCIPTPFKILFL